MLLRSRLYRTYSAFLFPIPGSRLQPMRQIVLDTETTGLEWKKGNRVVEIGCVELVERRPTGRTYHQYIHPEREFEPGAQDVTEIGRASCRDRVCQYVSLSVVAGSVKKKHQPKPQA